MRTINIFLTDPIAGELPDFENGEMRYAFARLYSDGPRRLVEGPARKKRTRGGRDGSVLLKINNGIRKNEHRDMAMSSLFT